MSVLVVVLLLSLWLCVFWLFCLCELCVLFLLMCLKELLLSVIPLLKAVYLSHCVSLITVIASVDLIAIALNTQNCVLACVFECSPHVPYAYAYCFGLSVTLLYYCNPHCDVMRFL